MSLRNDADKIIAEAIHAAMPDEAVHSAIQKFDLGDRITLIAVGKAAVPMACAAVNDLGDRIVQGMVITKYGHGRPIHGLRVWEAGHPVPDEQTLSAAKAAEELAESLTEKDVVLFLLSGGGSALFEDPLLSLEELQDITNQLLSCGADIREINTIRKRLSRVKGGRFAQLCAPAKVYNVILSDVLGDLPDMIASGPTCEDQSTCDEALAIVKKYDLCLSEDVQRLLKIETPRSLPQVKTEISGSVRILCAAAEKTAAELGYEPILLTTELCCQAREAGSFLASVARSHAYPEKPKAFIAGGETVVKLTGSGLGGRNQELVLSAAKGIDGIGNVLIFSIGSDGTDGPTDAAGACADGNTAALLRDKGILIDEVLQENDAYHALDAVSALIRTGPTGTNVNDLSVVLIQCTE